MNFTILESAVLNMMTSQFFLMVFLSVHSNMISCEETSWQEKETIETYKNGWNVEEVYMQMNNKFSNI